MATTTVLHEPRLDTILMVEREIQRSKSYSTKKELWQSLPRKLQYQTFNRILDYLESSNKILLDEGEIVWTFPSNPRLRRLLRKTVSSCASALAIPESLLVILASQEHLHPKLISSRNDVKRTFFASSSLNGYKYGFNHA